jgi:hypothetical protein
MGIQLVDAGRQGVPRRRCGLRCSGLRRGRRQGIGLSPDDGGPALLMVVTDGDRVNTQIAGQLLQDDLSLDPELDGRALYAQRQDMMAAAGKSIPRGRSPPGRFRPRTSATYQPRRKALMTSSASPGPDMPLPFTAVRSIAPTAEAAVIAVGIVSLLAVVTLCQQQAGAAAGQRADMLVT